MPRFRKLPVTIEAERFTDENKGLEIIAWANGLDGRCWANFNGEGKPSIAISTLEGVMTANLGDWIIKGIRNEFYPCKNDIFEATYEAVE